MATERARRRIAEDTHNLGEWLDIRLMRIVCRLPHRVVYWCMIRAWANATTGPYSDLEAPAVTMDHVARAWGKRIGGDELFQGSPSRSLYMWAEAAIESGIRAYRREVESMRHADIEAQYGIRPGEHCAGCGVPITADEIVSNAAVTVGGETYHYDCVDPLEANPPEDSAQIAVDHDRQTKGW